MKQFAVIILALLLVSCRTTQHPQTLTAVVNDAKAAFDSSHHGVAAQQRDMMPAYANLLEQRLRAFYQAKDFPTAQRTAQEYVWSVRKYLSPEEAMSLEARLKQATVK